MVNNIIDIVGMKYILISREKSMDITKVKIIADSSADVMHLEGVPFSVAPLKIITDEKEYIDIIISFKHKHRLRTICLSRCLGCYRKQQHRFVCSS